MPSSEGLRDEKFCTPRLIEHQTKVQDQRPKRLFRRNVAVDCLVIWFGIGSWIAINGLFVQLPLLVQTQPEGWNLPSYFSVIIQVANVGPILYSIGRRIWPEKIKDCVIIQLVLLIGTVALILMALYYKETTYLFGLERSTALLSLVFFIALVGCTSSVLFMPFMADFPEIYLISYFVGEGLSGFIPSIVALVQGVGGNPACLNQTNSDGTFKLLPYIPLPNFSTHIFFSIIFCISLCSLAAFTLLNYLRKNKRSMIWRPQNFEFGIGSKSYDVPSFVVEKDSRISFTEYKELELMSGVTAPQDTSEKWKPLKLSSIHVESLNQPIIIYLLLLEAWVCLLGNGIFPSIQSYSCLPYGNLVYHLSVTLGSMANPVACLLAFFLPTTTVQRITTLTVISAVISCWITTTALLSPSPPFLNAFIGDFIVVMSWIINTGLISFIKMAIAALCRRENKRTLFWCGAVQQVGSAIGAFIAFTLINFGGLFTPYYPCV